MGVCVLQVTLAYKSIVLYMCEGKVLMDSKVSSYVLFNFDINNKYNFRNVIFILK